MSRIQKVPGFSMSNHHQYQYGMYCGESDDNIMYNIVYANTCQANHERVGHSSTDICIIYKYKNGGCDHWNLNWLIDWIKVERPHLMNKINNILLLR